MILDSQLYLATAVATTAGDYNSVDVIDTQAVGGAGGSGATAANSLTGGARDLGSGEPLHFVITIPTTWAGGTNAICKLMGGPNADKTSGSFIGNLTNTLTVANNQLDKGKVYKAIVPSGLPGAVGTTLPRYIWVQATTTGTMSAGGVFNVSLVLDVQDGKTFYASGFTA